MPTQDDLLRWVEDPLLEAGVIAVFGAVITHVLSRRHPARRLFGQLAFFAILTTLMMAHGIVPYDIQPPGATPVERVSIGLAKIIWWTHAAWSLVAIIRAFLIIEGQPREGRLAQDLAVGVVYVAAALSVVSCVFEAPIGSLIATSGVLAIILGLALQSTLSDVFSGLALSLNRPYVIGDRIVLDDGTEGLVAETSWRSTHLINGSNDLVIIPNSNLAKSKIINLSSPSRAHGVSVTVQLSPTATPAAMAEVLRSALESSNLITRAPPGVVLLKRMDAASVEFELAFHAPDAAEAGQARNEVLDLVFRHLKASGLSLAWPSGSARLTDSAGQTASSRPMAMRLLDAVSLFSALDEDASWPGRWSSGSTTAATS